MSAFNFPKCQSKNIASQIKDRKERRETLLKQIFCRLLVAQNLRFDPNE